MALLTALILCICALALCVSDDAAAAPPRAPIRSGAFEVGVRRFEQNPIIHPGLPGLDWDNINGPCLIRVPAWMKSSLAKYYLYFANHRGGAIKLALADELHGPWRIHEHDVLTLDQTRATGHIASPDVLVDHRGRSLRMYFHGGGAEGHVSYLALSEDGLRFEPTGGVIARDVYLRVFEHRGSWYGIVDLKGASAGAGLYRSPDGFQPFVPGPRSIIPWARHSAVYVRDDRLWVFFSRVGDAPEQILVTTMDISGDWETWSRTQPETHTPVVAPQAPYEGTGFPLRPSTLGPQTGVHQLRDPFFFEEAGRSYILYSIAGESGIAIAEITLRRATATR